MTTPNIYWRCNCGNWTDGTRAWSGNIEPRREGLQLDYERKDRCPKCVSPTEQLQRMRAARRAIQNSRKGLVA